MQKSGRLLWRRLIYQPRRIFLNRYSPERSGMNVNWAFQDYSMQVESWCVAYLIEVGQDNSGLIGSSRFMLRLARQGTLLYSRSDLKDGLVSLEYYTWIYSFHLTTHTLPLTSLKEKYLPVLPGKFQKDCRRINSAPCRFPWDQVVSCEPIKRQYLAHGFKLNNKQNFTHFPPSRLPVFIYLNFSVKPGHRGQETWALHIFY